MKKIGSLILACSLATVSLLAIDDSELLQKAKDAGLKPIPQSQKRF